MAAAGITLDADKGEISQRWAECLRQTGAGDTKAFGQFYDQTCRLVYGLARRILCNHADAEEVTSEVYSYVWRSAATFDESRGSALAWLMVLTRSRALDRARSRTQALKRHQSVDAAAGLPAPGASVETGAWLSQRSLLVRRALGELPREQRDLLELAYFDGLSHSELAERCGLPLGTVKTRIRAGMIRLRELLSPQQERYNR
jgi:RNA polymerase sigma-70 factor (ECF subfamily)